MSAGLASSLFKTLHHMSTKVNPVARERQGQASKLPQTDANEGHNAER